MDYVASLFDHEEFRRRVTNEGLQRLGDLLVFAIDEYDPDVFLYLPDNSARPGLIRFSKGSVPYRPQDPLLTLSQNRTYEVDDLMLRLARTTPPESDTDYYKDIATIWLRSGLIRRDSAAQELLTYWLRFNSTYYPGEPKDTDAILAQLILLTGVSYEKYSHQLLRVLGEEMLPQAIKRMQKSIAPVADLPPPSD